MSRAVVSSVVVPLIVSFLIAGSSSARTTARDEPATSIAPPATRTGDTGGNGALFATAAATTTVIYFETFDLPGSCTAAGWTEVDLTTQQGVYFHIDDYDGLGAAFSPLAGTKSLWCGARPYSSGPLCLYATLPGYGNSWDQFFGTKDCIPVTGNLDVSFLMHTDSEPSYDATWLEYTTDCSGAAGWTELDGGQGIWDNDNSFTINTSYAVGGATDVRVRLRFRSDGAFSDEDGFWFTDGAVHIDNLAVEGLPLEDFEGEAVGATSSDDWEASVTPGFGSPAFLVNGSTVLQQDPCANNLSCVWAFFEGSTYDYSCGGHPEQTAVPYGNATGQYLYSEIRSPDIPLSSTGPVLVLEFSVYRDLPLDNLVFYLWRIRSGSGSCPGKWRDKNLRYFSDQKDWYVHREDVSALVDLNTATFANIGLAARDFCGFHCGILGSGDCHSHAPLIDNVKLLRIDSPGPAWSNQERAQFQDNFPSDGTITGTVRADAARDVNYYYGNPILPVDAATVSVMDPVNGLATDATFGGDAVYMYVAVWPQGQPGKSGAGLVDAPATWPVVGTWTDMSGTVWTQIRMAAVNLPVYDVDLRDDLFTPGDTVCFFYAAKNAIGVETYAHGSALNSVTLDREQAASDPGEFTCLPAGGYNSGGDILYVDGMDGRGAQPFWDTAFAALGLTGKVDRYDVRDPSTKETANRLDSRVVNITQLLTPYRKILWDCGDLPLTLGDGTVTTYSWKTNDYGLMNDFLDGLTEPGGVYLCGDDMASSLNALAGESAVMFRSTYLTHTLASGNARPTYGIAPAGTPAGGSFFGDSFVVMGGCPLINDFDVMEPTGASTMEIAYGAPSGSNGAVLAKTTTNSQTVDVGAVLSGFSFIYIADDDADGVPDRTQHLHDIITWLGNVVNPPTVAGPRAYRTGLDQNYPNPFNPQTTIAFSLRERGLVRVVVYDVAGARVRTIANEEFAAGAHTRVWDGRNDAGAPVASGVYFYELVAGDFRQTRKMVLLK